MNRAGELALAVFVVAVQISVLFLARAGTANER